MPQHLSQYLERDRGGDEQHLPIDVEPPHQLPEIAEQAGEDEGREMPDRVLGADFAQAAPGKAAPHEQRHGDPLAPGQRRQPDHRPDDGAGIGTGDQASQVGASEGHVGRGIAQQDPAGDAGRQRHPEGADELDAFGPVAPFGQQQRPEPPEPHQHRRQRRDAGQLHDERDQQVLLR